MNADLKELRAHSSYRTLRGCTNCFAFILIFPAAIEILGRFYYLVMGLINPYDSNYAIGPAWVLFLVLALGVLWIGGVLLARALIQAFLDRCDRNR